MLDLSADTRFGPLNPLLDFVDGSSLLQCSDAARSFCNIPFGFAVFERIPFLDADIASVGKDISFWSWLRHTFRKKD